MTARACRAEQIAVGFPAVVDECTEEAGEHPQRIESQLPPVGVTGNPGELRRRPRVPPVPLADDPPPGFVGVGDLGRLKGLTDQIPRRRQSNTRVFAGGQPRSLRPRSAEEVPIRAAVRWSGILCGCVK